MQTARNIMYKSEVKAGDYVVICSTSDTPVASACRLGANIAVTIYDPVHKKAALALDISTAVLHRMFNEFPDYKDRKQLDQLLEVRLVGGNNSEQSKQAVLQLIDDLNSIDNGRHIINVVSADILDKPHPNSFLIDARDGHVAALEEDLMRL